MLGPMSLAMPYLPYLIYGVPLLGLFVWALRRRARLEAVSADTFAETVEAGLTQPPSLHPIIDPARCVGCASCVHACPEFPAHQVLGILSGKAGLVSPTDCIGHGACQRACPTGAISLVFGTAERGVDLPAVNPDFSTNVEGVYIAGELGGMGLIRNAIEQGRRALDTIAADLASPGSRGEGCLDVVIVGAGPAGIAATLGAMAHELTYRTIEQHTFGGTVANFPRGKIVMTAPAELPLVGKVKFRETTKEKLVGFWERVRSDTGMTVSYGERLLGIKPTEEGLEVTTSRSTYRSRTVLLAIGRRGTPRRLGVPGEELAKVSYSLVDPAEHRGRAVLVVGGGDSALEAACSVAEQPGTDVTLSYRSGAFTRAKKKNRLRLESLAAEGRLEVLLESQVLAIDADSVLVEVKDQQMRLPNEAVIICAGGILPDGLLRDVGIGIETKYGTA
jgi:thioredoxin reductase/NAD-dependent dihydropyrimidine dehydrogenase PreA subunit